jgi:hypothetical protein
MAIPTNKSLYSRVKSQAKRKFKVWPSAYASSWLVKEYKRRGGKYSGKNPRTSSKRRSSSKKRRSTSFRNSSGIDRWMKEKWINICKLPKKVSCGRKKLSKSWKKNYPVCRPSIRVNSSTPTLASQVSASTRKRICSMKRRNPLKKLKKIKSKSSTRKRSKRRRS